MSRILRLLVVTLILTGDGDAFAQTTAPITACDRLAAHPADERRVVEGVAWDLMNERESVRACEQAVKLYPQELRFQYQLGRALIRAKRRDEGLPYLFDVAEKGYLAAFANIGGTYQFDLGNLAEALKWYRRGAELDDVSSQTHLAEMYLEGWGVERNLAEALKWFMPSARRGYPLSEYKVGLVYQRGGDHVPRDLPQAIDWFNKAAAHGFARAQNDLGVLHEAGDGVPGNLQEAAQWYRLAAEQGWALAQINLAQLYEHGRGVEQNRAEAFYWYRLATQARSDAMVKTARQGVDRTRKRLSSAEIAAADRKIGAWRSLSQEESAIAVGQMKGSGSAGSVAALGRGASTAASSGKVVDPVYTPPPSKEVDESYRPESTTDVGAAPAATVEKNEVTPKSSTVLAAKPAAESDIEAERPDIVPEFAVYVAAKTANIRAGPSTGSERIGRLNRGENVTILGRVVGKNWVMVSTHDERIGYIYGDLIQPDGANDTQLALQAQPKPEPQSAVERESPPTARAEPPKDDTEAARSREPVEVPGFGRYYALVIGINEYTQLPRLQTAINDAQAIAQVLRDSYGYEVKTLLDATRADIIRTLDDYRRQLTDQDNLLIYYAGHGYLDTESDRGYWLPADAAEDTQVSWISNITITDSLKAMEANHAMLIVDSCYSGTLTRGLKVTLRGPEAEKRLAQKRVRVVLTSGGLEPVVDGGGGKHSVFAKAVLDALRSNTGVMKGTELALQVRRPVMLEANQTPDYADLRFAGHEGGDFVFAAQR